MAQPVQATTFDLDVGLYLDIESQLALLSPFDIPYQGGQGADGKSALTTGSVFEKEYAWLDEELLTPRSTLEEAGFDNIETDLTVATGHGARFGIGDLIVLEAEEMRVTAVAGDVLTVTRGVAGTSAAAHAQGVDVVGVGKALPEGSDPEDPRFIDRVRRFNYTEIFGPEAVRTSATEQVVKKYGIEGTTEHDHQVANRLKEIAIGVEQALALGRRFEDTGANWRGMGGLAEFNTVNVDSSTATLTETALLDALQLTFEQGGMPDRATVSPKQKRTASAFNTAIQIRVDRLDNGRGQVVESFDSDFGRISLLLNRWYRDSDVDIFAREQAEIVTLRPIVYETLAKTGDSVHGQVVGEKGFKFRRASHAFRFTALT